jgi:peptidoglycan/LPS O-acetylase OafA/YrhL
MLKHQLYSLQIGRALAAIAVVSHHAANASQFFYKGMEGNYLQLFHLGYFGVDYFFVLSGFIIAHSTRSLPMNKKGARGYLLSRALRIYVPYLPISIVMIAMLSLLPSVSMAAREGFSIMGSLFLLPSNSPTAVTVAWTLQYEVIFYLLFGICFFWLRNPRFIYVWLVPILALSFFPLPRWAYFLVGTANIKFLLGVMICSIYHTQKLYSFRYLLAASGIILVIISALFSLYSDAAPVIHLLTGVGFAFFILGVAHIERDIDFSRCRWLLLLGSASYAIYLVHGPAISVLARFSSLVPNGYIAFTLFVILSCGMGVFYYQWVEKPLLAAAKRYFIQE